jgi:hypothetical protein
MNGAPASPRMKYWLADLLAECDENDPMPIDQEWDRMRPVGGELL